MAAAGGDGPRGGEGVGNSRERRPFQRKQIEVNNNCDNTNTSKVALLQASQITFELKK